MLVLFIFMTMLSSLAFASEDTALYVAPYGNDFAAGTIDAPLATMDGARNRVRELKQAGTYINEVIFRGGDYRITSSVNFTSEDSGTEANPIVYRAYEGEKPVFKGSVLLDNTKAKTISSSDSAYGRIHSDAKGKIVYFDLTEHGLTKSDICDTSKGKVCFDSRLTELGEYNTLFIDNKEVDISSWPNGNKYTAWGSIPASVPNGEKGRIFCYTDSNPEKWVNAPEGWWIAASPQHDFQYITLSVERIDTDADTITVVPNEVGISFAYAYNNQGDVAERSRKWKAYNLLEEIDVPGEFSIDRENMRLYLYPPHNIADSKLELSVLGKKSSSDNNSALVQLTDANNIIFNGLVFSQSRQNGVALREINNVDFIDCTFTDIAGRAITNGNVTPYYIEGGNVKTGFDPYGDHEIAYQTTPNPACLIANDSSYNMDIKGCIFSSIGINAIYVQGGNIDSLTKSGNIIENNYLTGINKRYPLYSAIYLSGCGNTLRNNVITHSSQNAVMINGSLHTVEKNEIYDVMRETGDYGAIYQGDSILYRGTEIKENYIHDIVPANPLVASPACGIYMDEGQQGNIIHNNIIVNAGVGYNSNWAGANKVTDNTIVGCKRPWAFYDVDDTLKNPLHNRALSIINERRADRGIKALTMAEYLDTIPDEYEDKYRETFPELFAWAEADTPFNAKKQSVYSGNLIVDCGASKIADQDNTYASWSRTTGKQADNIRVSSTMEFSDAQNHNYALKSGYPISLKLPGLNNTDNFDMSSVGLTVKGKIFNVETSPYRLLYPADNTSVNSKNLMLMWQEAFGANEYVVEIATDMEFQNTIYSATSRYNHIDAPSAKLSSGNTYYWRVKAVNTSKDMANIWMATDALSNFTIN